mmetsp:Transcript_34559/g.104217  ORF Transcript_34559/g.104217 Transcript_34559/m.104217 type:complete len:551 (+) Transcript_34559:26-1678(+)
MSATAETAALPGELPDPEQQAAPAAEAMAVEPPPAPAAAAAAAAEPPAAAPPLECTVTKTVADGDDVKPSPSSGSPSRKSRDKDAPETPDKPVEVLAKTSPSEAVYIPATLEERYPFLSSSRRADAATDYDALATDQQWPAIQASMFRRTVKLLEASHLARLAHLKSDELGGRSASNQPQEAALVMLHTSRCAEKLRTIFAETSWDPVLASWLNGTLLDSLDCELLEEYVDMLRHLRLKCPEIMEARGLLAGAGSRRLAGNQQLQTAISKPPDMNPAVEPKAWDFPVEPVLVLAPCEHSWSSPHLAGWRRRLAALGKLVGCQETAAMARDVHTMAKTLFRKVREVRVKYPSRPVVLVGMSVGSKVAITVSFKERVDCLICLGLQLQGITGNTADAVDMRDLLQLKPPTLFAIGSQSWLSPVAKMEQIRLQMIPRNKLVIVCEADENLRIPLSKRLKVKMTQAMSDQLVLNEIGNFVHDTLLRMSEQESLTSPKATQSSPAPAAAAAAPDPVADGEEEAAAAPTGQVHKLEEAEDPQPGGAPKRRRASAHE